MMQRLVFALSLSDLVSSLSFLLMPWLIPSEIGLPGAVGNHASCAAIGFGLMTFILVGCFYNAYLSVYFFLVVRRRWRDADFERSPAVEIVSHIFAVVVPMSIGIAGMATQSINPSPLLNSICTYASYPWDCNENPDIECTRSSREVVTALSAAGGSLIVFFTILGFCCTFLVALTIRTTIRRNAVHRFEGDRDEAGEARIRNVTIQAILYSLAYLNTFFWPHLLMLLSHQFVNSGAEIQEKKTQAGYYAFQVLSCTFYPLQGFLNFFIYTRLKVDRLRKQDPDRSLFWIYRQIVMRVDGSLDSTNRDRRTTNESHTTSK